MYGFSGFRGNTFDSTSLGLTTGGQQSGARGDPGFGNKITTFHTE
jgi:hypothetical protein